MCLLTLEWSEAIVSCDGISVKYNLSVTPDVEDGTEVDVYSGAENRYTYTVNGSVGLQYNFNLATEICDGQHFTMSRPVDLSGMYYILVECSAFDFWCLPVKSDVEELSCCYLDAHMGV